MFQISLSFLIITDFELFLKQNYPKNHSYLSTVFDSITELYVLCLHMHIKIAVLISGKVQERLSLY